MNSLCDLTWPPVWVLEVCVKEAVSHLSEDLLQANKTQMFIVSET